MHYLKMMNIQEIKGLDLQILTKVINEFGLHTNYPSSPFPIYKKIGAKLSKQTLPDSRLAFSGWHPKYNIPFAIFDKSLKGLDLHYALWHELSHLLFDEPSHEHCLIDHPIVLRQKGETICDLRASYISVPFNEMMQMYRDGWYDTQVAGALKVPVKYLKLRHDIYTGKEHPYIWNAELPLIELPGL